MKILKMILTALFYLLILVLMVTPLGLIFQISNAEMAEYAVPDVPVLQEVAIGKVAQAQKTDVAEYISLRGEFTSNTYAYMELEYRNPDLIRWYVNLGDEVQEGQTIGEHKGAAVVATVTGILVEMQDYGNDAYLRFQLLSPVEFICDVDDRLLSVLKRSDSLTTEDGAVVELIHASKQKNADGTTRVRLSIDSDVFVFGQELRDLRILTGRVYQDTIVLPVECVYQKDPGEENPWYVRQVTESGIFVGELEVQIGYANEDYVCVSGIRPDGYYDTGYKTVAGG